MGATDGFAQSDMTCKSLLDAHSGCRVGNRLQEGQGRPRGDKVRGSGTAVRRMRVEVTFWRQQ